MAEYINREAAIKKFKERCSKCDARFEDPLCLQCSGRSDLEIVCGLPAADVAPVVHGRWLDAGRGIKACSNCNHGIKEHMACVNHYCPNCGARMDGGANECD